MRAFLSSRLFILLFGVIALFAVIIASIPSLISTHWGQKKVVAWINQSIPGKVEIRSLNLNWFHGQSVEGLTLHDAHGNKILGFEKLHTEANLWKLITKSTHLGQTNLDDFNAIIVTDKNGISNLQHALGILPQEASYGIPPSTIILSEVKANLNIFSKGQPLSIDISGQTRQDSLDGSFSIRAILPGLESENWKQISKNAQQLLTVDGSKEAFLEAHIQNFPIDLFDRIASIKNPQLNGMFRSLLGNKLKVDLNKVPSVEGLAFNLNFVTPQLEGSVKGDIINQILSIKQPAAFIYTINPEAINPFIKDHLTFVSPGKIKLNIEEVNLPFEIFQEDSKMQSKGIVKLSLNSFPLKLISILENSKEIDQFIGSEVNLEATIKPEGFKHYVVDLTVKTDKLEIRDSKWDIDEDVISILQPIKMTYQVSVEAINEQLKDSKLLATKAAPFTITVNKGKFSIKQQNLTSIQADISSPELAFKIIPTAETIRLEQINITIDGSPTKKLSSKITMRPFLNNADGTPSSLIKEGNFEASLNIITENKKTAFTDIVVNYHSEQANVNIQGNITPDLKFTAAKPIQMSYLAPQDLLEKLQLNSNSSFLKLKNTPLLNLTVDPFEMDLKNINPYKTSLKGTLLVDKVILEGLTKGEALINDLDIPWEINPALNMVRLNIKGQASTDSHQKPSTISSQLHISNWIKDDKLDLSTLKVEVKSTLIGLPTQLISSFITLDDVTPLFGNIVDLEFKTLFDKTYQSPGYWDMILDTPLLHLKSRLKFEEALTLYESTSKALEVRWEITPEGFKQLNKILGQSNDLQLTNSVNVKMHLTDLYVPIHAGSLVFNQSKINASIETSEITVKNSAIIPFKIKGQVHVPNLNDLVEFSLQTTSKDESSALAVTGQLSQWLDANNKTNFEKARVKLDLNGTNVPHEVIAALAALDPEKKSAFKAFIGDKVNIKSTLDLKKMEGPLTTEVKGNHGETSLSGKIKKNILTLDKPFEIQIKITPELTQYFLKEKTPVLSSLVQAEEPIRLKVQPKDVSIPLKPFDLNKIIIPKGEIQLGKVQFRNEGDLKSVLNILKPIHDKYFTIWFTPAYFQLKNGAVTLYRTDMLIASDYHLATWGTIKLENKKINLTLGLTEQALRSIFGIQGLDSSYVLQIPLQGENGNIGIDKTKVLAKISALVAKSQANDKLQLLGNVLELATNGFQDASAPEPTTKIPWVTEKRANPTNTNSPSNKDVNKSSEKKKPQDKLIEELEKGASSLFNFIKT